MFNVYIFYVYTCVYTDMYMYTKNDTYLTITERFNKILIKKVEH